MMRKLSKLEEIDKQIAMKVFGWRFEDYHNGGGFWHRQKNCKRTPHTALCACGGSHMLPDFTVDPTDSKMLRDKLAADGWSWDLGRYGHIPALFVFVVKKEGQQLCSADAETEEMAVALAACKVYGIEA